MIFSISEFIYFSDWKKKQCSCYGSRKEEELNAGGYKTDVNEYANAKIKCGYTGDIIKIKIK